MAIKQSLAIIYFLILICFYALILRRKLIIVCDKYGRLANRLFLYAQLIEFAHQSNRELWAPGFHDYAKLFETTKKKRFFTFSSKKDYTPNPFSALQSFYAFDKISKINEKLGNKRLLQNFHNYLSNDINPFKKMSTIPTSCILFKGFIFHQHFLDLKNSLPNIKKLFKPASQFEKEINDPINRLRKKADVVIGVLIRQTDYRQWNEGKCFFTSIEYAQILSRLKISFQGQRLSFFIATDEEQNDMLFKSYDCIIRVGFPVQNLYSLAQCDLLIGPSSSYIAWSAAYSGIPLHTIQTAEDSPSKASFTLNYS